MRRAYLLTLFGISYTLSLASVYTVSAAIDPVSVSQRPDLHHALGMAGAMLGFSFLAASAIALLKRGRA